MARYSSSTRGSNGRIGRIAIDSAYERPQLALNEISRLIVYEVSHVVLFDEAYRSRPQGSSSVVSAISLLGD